MTQATTEANPKFGNRGLVLTPLRRDDDEPEVRPFDFRLALRLLRYTRPYAAKMNWLFFLVVTRSIMLAAAPALLAWIVNIDGPIARHDARGLARGIIAFAALALVMQFSFHFRQRLALELGESVVHDMRRDIFAHLQSMTLSYFGRTKLGRIISRITSDIDAVRVAVQDVLFMAIVQGGMMLVTAGYMLWYNRKLFLVLLAIAPVLYVINFVFRRKLSRIYREIQESFSRVTSTLAESVGGIKVTQGFVRQDVNAEMFSELVQDHGEYNMRSARTAGMFIPLLEFNSQVFYAALLVVAAYMIVASDQTPEERRLQANSLVTFLLMAPQFFGPIQNLGQFYNQTLVAMAGAERIFGVLDTKPDWSDPPDAAPLPPIQGGVEFRDVGFAYVPGRPVLRHVSFTTKPGQTVALVGQTGGGKSTIINLIAKFYLPTEGQVFVDGHDITQVNTDSLHRQLGIVLQNNFLFTGTVMDNIRMGRAGASDAEVLEAARRLDVLDLLESMPDGLATNVGERGGLVSLGQRQLICFCRAMLADPRILILDEATSSVDTMTEARIQKALGVLLQGRTSFVVAHRLSTIRKADLILVIDRGLIVERGTHRQLLATGGIYAHLYRKFIRASEA
jgi:ATP-binding cassette subfamily B protein